MANSAKPVANLAVATSIVSTDRIVILTNTTTTANVKTVNTSVFVANLVLSNSVPANSTSNGTVGTIRWDSDYVYICVSNNVWKRATLSTY